MRIVQQSFVVPVAAAGELVAQARRRFAAAGVVPMLSDVLYCPADAAWLSATLGRGGFVVSFAFSPRTAGRHARIGAALAQLSAMCRQLGGRVRLCKHVHAERDDLDAMYGDALSRFLQLKRRLDPDDALRNDFFERVLAPGATARPERRSS
jgi:FAD/FMN-containing dehydrogenase